MASEVTVAAGNAAPMLIRTGMLVNWAPLDPGRVRNSPGLTGSPDPFGLHLIEFEHFASVVREDELVNTLKPLLVVAVLAGIGYGVYVRINSGHNAPPPGVAEGWETAPKVQLPDSAQPGGVAWGAGAGSGNSGIAPGIGVGRSVPSPAAAARGDAASPYYPQPGGAGQYAAP